MKKQFRLNLDLFVLFGLSIISTVSILAEQTGHFLIDFNDSLHSKHIKHVDLQPIENKVEQ